MSSKTYSSFSTTAKHINRVYMIEIDSLTCFHRRATRMCVPVNGVEQMYNLRTDKCFCSHRFHASRGKDKLKVMSINGRGEHLIVVTLPSFPFACIEWNEFGYNSRLYLHVVKFYVIKALRCHKWHMCVVFFCPKSIVTVDSLEKWRCYGYGNIWQKKRDMYVM
jgi:hypothetical protein